MEKQKEFWNIMLLIFSSYKKKLLASYLNVEIMYKTRDVEYGRAVLI